MRYCNQGRFRQQMRFLRRQFLQDGTFPFSDVLSESIVGQALTAIKVSWLDRIYSPLVTLWVFLGQVLSADHSCRAAVARLIAHRLSQGQASVLRRDGRLLPSQKASARRVFLERGPSYWLRFRIQCRFTVAVEGSPRLHLRWIDSHDARYAGEPARLPAERSAATWLRLSHRANRGRLFTGLRRGARFGHLSLRWQRTERVRVIAHLWTIFRPGDVVLGDRLMCAVG